MPNVDATSLKPRNDGVIVRLIKNQEERVGVLHLPTGSDEYCEAEVLAVGRGEVLADGGQPATSDLEPGQRVLVQYQTLIRDPQGMVRGKRESGLRLDRNDDIFLFAEINIICII